MKGRDEPALLAERMRQLQAMHRRLVHDLRGNLNALVLHLDLLSATVETSGDERQARYVDALRRSLDGLHVALMRTLELLKIWGTETERFDAGELIDEVVALLSGAAKARGVKMIASRPEDGPFVKGSRDAINHVVVALTWRAIHVSERGARLELVTGSEGGNVGLAWQCEPVPDDGGEDGSLDVSRQIVEAHGGRLDGPQGTRWARLELPADVSGAG